MTSKAKAKGNSWELEIAKFLTSLYNEPFVRVPQSGAFIGGSNSIRKQSLDESKIRTFKGDIIPGESFTKLNIEAKNYKDFPFHQLVTSDCKQLEAWLSQLLDVADDDDINLLMFKITRKGKFIAIEEKHFNKLLFPENYIRYKSSKFGNWIIIDFDSFWGLNANIIKLISI